MTTVRLWFTKTGEAAYISLLDLQRVMQRALKRSGLPVWYTLGFNPHIYMTFAAPLSLGQESLVESLDFKSEDDHYDWHAAQERLAACLPKGIDLVKLEPAKMDPSKIAFARYELQVEKQHAALAIEAFDAYNAAPQAVVVKEGKRGKKKEVDLKQYVPVLDYKNRDGGLVAKLILPAGSVFTVNPALVLGWLCGSSRLEPYQVRILRTELLTGEREKFC